MAFDEESVYKTVPMILKKLIGKDKESAKDYIKRKRMMKKMRKIKLNITSSVLP